MDKGDGMAELVYQKKRKDIIKNKTASIRRSCNKGIAQNLNESDTRINVINKILEEALGWEFGKDIDTESPSKIDHVKLGSCDYVINYKGKPYMVIEAKQINKRLNEDVLQQANLYAMIKQIKWIVLTNGNEWKVYRLTFEYHKNENPRPIANKVFETKFVTNEEETPAKKKNRIEKLYLLSKEAQKKQELEEYYNLHQVYKSENLVQRILSKEVLDRIRVAIRRDTSFNVTNKEIARNILKIIQEEKLPAESELNKILRKIK